MDKDVKALTEALQTNLELVRLLSHRIEQLENATEENAAQRMAVMLLLRAVVQCSPQQDEIADLAERMAAHMQVQPGILLHGNQQLWRRTREHVQWMTAPARSAG